jgi:hypothetical protein
MRVSISDGIAAAHLRHGLTRHEPIVEARIARRLIAGKG